MPINYLESEGGFASSSPLVSLCEGMMNVRRRWKGMMVAGGALMVWYSSYGGGKIETWLSGGESGQSWNNLFIIVEGGSRAVQGG
jgi:hypothetical protein